ncbi:conserved hypothetical protein [Ricinus communis]|uniref:Uncharacterized protein n=1 Tax=Ricinus communis TaxID=3988 RepID=B9RRK2_RICCO|nr:conserved hypothetical protein [Ricinus communis]
MKQAARDWLNRIDATGNAKLPSLLKPPKLAKAERKFSPVGPIARSGQDAETESQDPYAVLRPNERPPPVLYQAQVFLVQFFPWLALFLLAFPHHLPSRLQVCKKINGMNSFLSSGPPQTPLSIALRMNREPATPPPHTYPNRRMRTLHRPSLLSFFRRGHREAYFWGCSVLYMLTADKDNFPIRLPARLYSCGTDCAILRMEHAAFWRSKLQRSPRQHSPYCGEAPTSIKARSVSGIGTGVDRCNSVSHLLMRSSLASHTHLPNPSIIKYGWYHFDVFRFFRTREFLGEIHVSERVCYVGPIWLGRLSVGWEGLLKGEGGPRSHPVVYACAPAPVLLRQLDENKFWGTGIL